MMWSDAFTYTLIVTGMVVVLHLRNYFKAVYLALKIPGPPTVPLLGNALLIYDSPRLLYLSSRISEFYGPLMRCWISIVPFFFFYEPKHLQIVLGSNKYSTKNMFYNILHNFIGDGLITSTGDRWKTHRKLIQPYFHVNLLKVFFDAFHRCSVITVNSLKNETDVNITLFANKFVLDVLHVSVLGISEYSENSPYRKGKLFVPYRIARPWLLLDSLFKMTSVSKVESEQKEQLYHYTKKILERKKKEAQINKNPVPNNLMEMLMEISSNNPDFTDDDIINETSTFMLAGQDSVGAALAFSLYFLAAYQDIQQKVVEELDFVYQGSNRTVTYEDVGEMKYLEQCIKETMRLYPSVPIICRKIKEDLTIGKYTFPKGTNLFVSPFITHRLPHVFPDPLKFDPDRFSPENKAKMHPYAYLPFSAGPRNCIGYKYAIIELKTIISEILRNYHLSLAPGFEKVTLSYRITLRAKGGIWLRVTKRNKV